MFSIDDLVASIVTPEMVTILISIFVLALTIRRDRISTKKDSVLSQRKQDRIELYVEQLLHENKGIMRKLDENAEKHVVTTAEIASLKVSVESIWMYLTAAGIISTGAKLGTKKLNDKET